MNYSVRTILSLACMTSLFALFGCSSSDDDNENGEVTDESTMTFLDDSALEQLEGVWLQRGYGNVYEYTGNRTTWYTVTSNTCLEVITDPGLVGLSEDDIAQTSYNLQANQLSLALPGEAFMRRLERLENLPARCEETPIRDVQGVFDFTWETFDEYYAFFDLRNVDWAAQYESQLPGVGEITDDESLFELLAGLLSPIDDGHVFLANDDNGYSPAVQRGANLELERGFLAQTEFTDPDDYVDSVFDLFENTLESQMDEGSIIEQGPLVWATINNGGVGYLFISGMDADGLLDDVDDADEIEELAAASAAMDLAMADLADTSRLIIDIRLNGGGLDAIGLNFAQRFVSERQLAFSKTARSRDFESVPVEAWLEPPATGAYLNPVTLIVGADTASAAEIFAIPMYRLPQVTVIGERTSGILSDILQKPLPNGWFVGLSNEVYLDAQGVSFEGAGLTPDVEVPVFRIGDIEAGVDPALQQALSM